MPSNKSQNVKTTPCSASNLESELLSAVHPFCYSRAFFSYNFETDDPEHQNEGDGLER
jgi:hypothetical protein